MGPNQEIVDENSVTHTTKFLEKLEKEMGFKIKTIQTYNGREFVNEVGVKKKRRKHKVEELGIEYRIIRPYSAWQNGKVERSHRLDSAFYARKRI